jgi:phosphomethylpyrimidine synthase
MTQFEAARADQITPEMKFVAQREDLPEELIKSEVARGRMVIPANTVHLTKTLEPMALGIAVAAASIRTYSRMSAAEDEVEAIALGFTAGLIKHLGLAIDIFEEGPTDDDVVH